MKKRHLVLFMVLVFFIFRGLGQAGDETIEPPLMKETVVTATRFEEEVSTVPANATVIKEEDIANSTAKDIPSILRTQVGVHVTDISGNRRTYRVDLRGFGETAQLNTLVLVDGRRTNQPDLSGSDWALIPLERVERIEIIRGGRGSVLYGDNASGGVINIITKEGEAFETGGELAGGSYDTLSANAYVSGNKNNISYALSGSYYDSDGYRDNSDSEAKDFGLNLGYFFEDTAKLSLSGGYHTDDTGLPGALKASDFAAGASRTDTTHPDDFSDVDDYYIKLLPEIFFLEDSLFKFDLSLRERDSTFFSSFTGGSFEGDTEIKTAIASPQFIFKEQVFGFDNNLTFGIDYVKSEEDILNTTFFMGFPSTDKFSLEKENHGYYIHDEIFLLENLALSGGYRYDKVEYRFDPSTPDETDFDENLFTAGINYNFFTDSYVYFSFAESFRYPVLDEIFDFFTNTIDATLVPQTSDNYELGIRHYFTQTLWAGLNLFRIDTEDEIFFDPTGGPFGFGANENFDDETRRDGVEVAAGIKFDQISLRASYTYTDAEILGGRFAGNDVPSVPEHMATFDSIFDLGRGFMLGLNGIYVGTRFFESDWANAFPKQDDYVVLNAKFKYNWKKYTAFLDINNILDEEYSEFGVLSSTPVEPAFYPSPEINFLVGISAAF
jgi:iron complex outermembrane receptor protein